MENTNKITEKQLETIVNQQKDLNTLLSNIGILESQKHGFLHQIAEVNKKIEEFKSELQAEYGDVNINVEDGTYTYITKPEEVTLEKVD
jgi:predicted  nucleic acid-binding Zn-ribbon protein